MDKYQWTCTGMSVQPVENGPMRYVREVDYDQLQAEVEELIKERNLVQAANKALLALESEEIVKLQAKVEQHDNDKISIGRNVQKMVKEFDAERKELQAECRRIEAECRRLESPLCTH